MCLAAGQVSTPSTSPASTDAVEVPRCIIALIDDVDVPAQVEGVLTGQVPLLDEKGEYLLEDGKPQYQVFQPKDGMEVKAGQPLLLIEDREAWKTYQAAVARLEGAAGGGKRHRRPRSPKSLGSLLRRSPPGRGSQPTGTWFRALLGNESLTYSEISYELQKQKAEHELNLAKVAVRIREAEAEGAWLALQRHIIRSPVDGIIVEVHRDIGEWVKPGDTVLRIVRMDRMRIEGYLAVSEVHPAEVADQPVLVRITTPMGAIPVGQNAADVTFTGQVVFVSPLIEAGGRYLVRAEVENRQSNGQWVLRPGLSADMVITRKRVGRLSSLPRSVPK